MAKAIQQARSKGVAKLCLSTARKMNSSARDTEPQTGGHDEKMPLETVAKQTLAR
jgi:hypothetical protein